MRTVFLTGFACAQAQVLYPPAYQSSLSYYQPSYVTPSTSYAVQPYAASATYAVQPYAASNIYAQPYAASTSFAVQPYAASTSFAVQPYAVYGTYGTSSYSLPSYAAAPQFLGAREQAVMNVVKGVNYALTLEHLESAFYRAVNRLYSTDADYSRLSPSNGERFNPAVVHARFLSIGAHEDAHVVTLSNLVTRLCSLAPAVPNCAPVRPCAYNFNLGNTPFDKNINTIVATAELLENTGVKAYDGAISSLIQSSPLSADGSVDSASIVEAAATIATVEARHAAFLSTIRGMDPFPQATDTPLKPGQVLCAARQFISNPSTCEVFNTAAC